MTDLEYNLKRLEEYADYLYHTAQTSDLANQEYIKTQEQIRNLKNILKGKE